MPIKAEAQVQLFAIIVRANDGFYLKPASPSFQPSAEMSYTL